MITLSQEEYKELKISIRSQFVTLEEGRGEIDNLYLAIAELSSRIEEKKEKKKKAPRQKIGFK